MYNYLKLLEIVLVKPDIVYKTGSKEMWSSFEKDTKIILPDDYKEFIQRYGTGGIGDFLWILTPFESDDNVNYIKRMNEMIFAYQVSKSKMPEYFKHNIFPEEDGLLPWGFTDNGDELYWKTSSTFSDWEIVIYESASPEYYHYKMSLTEFLYKIITKQVVCDIFPEDLFGEQVEYIAVGD